MLSAGFEIERGCGGAEVRVEAALMDVDADADHCEGDSWLRFCAFDEDSAGFARADEQIVGPAQIDGQAAGGADRLGSSETGGERQQRQAGWRESAGAAGR